MKKILMLMGLLAVFGFASIEATAQSKVNVRFAAGKTTGYYNGSIRGAKYIDYVMRAKGGQTLRVVFTKKTGAPVYFNVLRPGSDVAISDEARQSQSFRGELPEDGAYVVRVYMEKADRLRNRTATYRIGFSIEVE
jgi:hypothetical protein